MLLPKNWEPIRLHRDPRIEIKTTEQGIDHLVRENGTIRTPDGLYIHHRYGYYVVEVPKARRQGGKYYLDKDFIRITGDFSSRGQYMRTEELEVDKLQRVITYLLEKDTVLMKGVDFQARRFSLRRTAEEEAAEVEASGSRYFSLVRNPDTLKRLEKEEYITTYRAAQIGQGWEIISSYGRDYWQGMGALKLFWGNGSRQTNAQRWCGKFLEQTAPSRTHSN